MGADSFSSPPSCRCAVHSRAPSHPGTAGSSGEHCGHAGLPSLKRRTGWGGSSRQIAPERELNAYQVRLTVLCNARALEITGCLKTFSFSSFTALFSKLELPVINHGLKMGRGKFQKGTITSLQIVGLPALDTNLPFVWFRSSVSATHPLLTS